MKPELEAILESYQAFKEALESGRNATDLYAIYDSRLDDVLARCPNLSKETLRLLVEKRHRAWLRAQDKPPSMPPRA